MPSKFKYVQHPHVAARKGLRPKNADAVLKEAGPRGFNQKIGYLITKGVGTMWAAYLFFLLSLISLPAVIIQGDPILIVSWIAQTCLQLVLLPIIIVGQNIQAANSERRAILTYEDSAAVLEEANQIQKHLEHQDQILQDIAVRLSALEAKKPKK